MYNNLMKKKIYILCIIVLILDQVTKIICDAYCTLNKPIPIISNFFSITYVHNEGAAWSILAGKRLILILIGLIALYILNSFIDEFKESKRNILAFGFLFGGVLGNLLDRIFLGYVRDYLDFKIFGYDYPIFNIGDIGIFIGVVLLIISCIKGEDYGSISRKKR